MRQTKKEGFLNIFMNGTICTDFAGLRAACYTSRPPLKARTALAIDPYV